MKFDDYQTMQFLKKINYKQMETNSNGSCLFNAIIGFLHYIESNCIITIGGVTEQNKSIMLRKKVIAFIKTNLDKVLPQINSTFKELIENNSSISVSNYLTKMSNETEWAGEIELFALSILLDSQIIVYKDNIKNHHEYELQQTFGSTNNPNLILLYYNQYANGHTNRKSGSHYRYLIPASDLQIKNKITKNDLIQMILDINNIGCKRTLNYYEILPTKKRKIISLNS